MLESDKKEIREYVSKIKDILYNYEGALRFLKVSEERLQREQDQINYLRKYLNKINF